MSFDSLAAGGLNYQPCRYKVSKLLFRGPERSLDQPFVAFIGGTETYGKFIEEPFVQMVEKEIGTTCVNFGCLNASIDAFLHDPFMDQVLLDAQVTVLQVTSPRNMSNRFYTVHARRNDRFVKPSAMLRRIYPEVDFSEFHFTRHMLTRLQSIAPDRFEQVIDELRIAWQARLHLLLNKIPGDVVLFWFADHAPGEPSDCMDIQDPWFVTEEMISETRPLVSNYVQVVASPAARSTGSAGMVFSDMEGPAANKMLGPMAHAEASAALAPVLEELIGTKKNPPE